MPKTIALAVLVAALAGAMSADATAKARPRPGRVLSLEAAIRELDLIPPGRVKLAHDFTAATMDGKAFRLSDHRGKPVFMNFWATWCAPCRDEMPAMERLFRQHREAGLVMVALSLDADPALVRPFVTQHKLSFTVALDSKMEVAGTYGVRAVPTSVLVDRQGNLVAIALGPRRWDTDAAHSLIEGLAR